jgi:hypothetical protein
MSTGPVGPAGKNPEGAVTGARGVPRRRAPARAGRSSARRVDVSGEVEGRGWNGRHVWAQCDVP